MAETPLDEVTDAPTIDHYITEYVAERGLDNMIAISVWGLGEGSHLFVKAHAAIDTRVNEFARTPKEDLPEIVRDTDVITINNRKYSVEFHEPSDFTLPPESVTVYAKEGITGETSVLLEDGLEAVHETAEASSSVNTAQSTGKP